MVEAEDCTFIISSPKTIKALNTYGGYLVDGFIRHAQSLLDYENNPYYLIQEDLISICREYIYWFRMDKITNDYSYKSKVYIDPNIIKQTLMLHHYGSTICPAWVELVQILLNRFSYACFNC